MSKKKAFITGISGQDGSFLSELLLEKDYRVYGMIRRHSVAENQDARLNHLLDKVETEYGDMTDPCSMNRMISKIKPDEVYNLAAMSHVRVSYDVPQFTTLTNSLGVIHLLESIKSFCPKAKFYQASSSEMFGDSVDIDNFQRETTPMHPVSPYGCTKLFSYHITRNYRKAYKMFAANGILFNHESERRGINFVTNKVVKAAVEIKLGLRNKLEMGNMDSFRDWGCSKDYVRAMWMILQHNVPDDFVISTGITHSVRNLCEYTFSRLNLDYKDYVVQNDKYLRPEELPYLRGDCTKAREILNWVPEYTFEAMIDEMIAYWEKQLS
jgi:GDPmannose 4,6-dehydratase